MRARAKLLFVWASSYIYKHPPQHPVIDWEGTPLLRAPPPLHPQNIKPPLQKYNKLYIQNQHHHNGQRLHLSNSGNKALHQLSNPKLSYKHHKE